MDHRLGELEVDGSGFVTPCGFLALALLNFHVLLLKRESPMSRILRTRLNLMAQYDQLSHIVQCAEFP